MKNKQHKQQKTNRPRIIPQRTHHKRTKKRNENNEKTRKEKAPHMGVGLSITLNFCEESIVLQSLQVKLVKQCFSSQFHHDDILFGHLGSSGTIYQQL